MNNSAESPRPGHWLKRLCYGIAALFCLALGVVGLVLPIIPGIVFLALGGVLLGKASANARTNFRAAPRHRFSSGGQAMRGLGPGFASNDAVCDRRYQTISRSLPTVDRLRLRGWLLARAAVNGLQTLSRAVSGVISR